MIPLSDHKKFFGQNLLNAVLELEPDLREALDKELDQQPKPDEEKPDKTKPKEEKFEKKTISEFQKLRRLIMLIQHRHPPESKNGFNLLVCQFGAQRSGQSIRTVEMNGREIIFFQKIS